MTVPMTSKIFSIILCVVGIVAIISFNYEKKTSILDIIEDILFCSPLVFFIVTLIMA